MILLTLLHALDGACGSHALTSRTGSDAKLSSGTGLCSLLQSEALAGSRKHAAADRLLVHERPYPGCGCDRGNRDFLGGQPSGCVEDEYDAPIFIQIGL